MTTQAILASAVALGLSASFPAGQPGDPPARPAERHVDLAICLDTSGSMKGLIDAARQNIWAIVNDLALAKPAPTLRVALVTFGNNGHPEADGWVKVETALTEDLDTVSQKLFALTTNGGDEYVGRVLQASLAKLEWSDRADALKLIVVAGNEGADQDPEVDFRAMASAAIAKGILVNSIYCGDPADEIAPGWREVATRADGQFAAIDKDNGTVVIETPFDAKLTDLSAKLNATYVPYGTQGANGQANQVAQDQNAVGLNGAAAAQRAFCKSWYNCATWDLVDALDNKTVELAKLKPEELPENMRSMTPEQRIAHVDTMRRKRAEIQKGIAELHLKREAFVLEEMKRQVIDGGAAFDFAVRRAVRAQAEAKGFAFPAPPKVAAKAGPAVSEPGRKK